MSDANDERITLAHGGGGRLSRALVQDVILPALAADSAAALEDSAVRPWPAGAALAFTTDSYVVKPLFFRGGDIGRLAVSGTGNDLAAAAARPLWLSMALVIEEGLPVSVLRRALESARRAAEEAGVEVVAGDTKVVERGAADGLFINTAGVGAARPDVRVSAAYARPGDRVLLSGALGEHGVAILSEREGLEFDTPVRSDVAPLAGLVHEMLDAVGDAAHCLRDPTRGGLAAALHEIAADSGVGIELDEAAIPVSPAVAAACDMLGLDVLSVANEGKMIAIVAADAADAALEALRGHPLGRGAACIGRVTAGAPGQVVLHTAVGGARLVDLPAGELLPRIC